MVDLQCNSCMDKHTVRRPWGSRAPNLMLSNLDKAAWLFLALARGPAEKGLVGRLHALVDSKGTAVGAAA